VTAQPAKRSTLSADYQRNWPEYFDAVANQPPRDTCLRALAAVARAFPGEPLRALDIAAGEGRDTRAMLAHGARWRVTATDASAEGLRRLRESLAPNDVPRVRIVECAMESLPARMHDEGRTSVHLINASFALPFCSPAHFPVLWTWIVASLVPQGCFAGQFFGDRDEWAVIRPQSHVTKCQLLALLTPFTIEHLEEVDKEGSDAMGGTKRHHVFHVVAKKASGGMAE
jgi:tellurite methyltransferase